MAKRMTVLLYGDPKVGKTTTAFATFSNSVCLAYDFDGMSAVEANLGYLPPYVEPSNLKFPFQETLELIDKAIAPAVAQGASAVVIDTLTDMCNRFLHAASIRFANPMQRYPVVYDEVQHVIRSIENLGVSVIALAHKQYPKPDRNPPLMGGPKLEGALAYTVPSMFSVIAMADIERASKRRVLRCDPYDPLFLMGDRYGCLAKVQDLDLRPAFYRVFAPGQEVPAFEPISIRRVEVDPSFENASGGGIVLPKKLDGKKENE